MARNRQTQARGSKFSIRIPSALEVGQLLLQCNQQILLYEISKQNNLNDIMNWSPNPPFKPKHLFSNNASALSPY